MAGQQCAAACTTAQKAMLGYIVPYARNTVARCVLKRSAQKKGKDGRGIALGHAHCTCGRCYRRQWPGPKPKQLAWPAVWRSWLGLPNDGSAFKHTARRQVIIARSTRTSMHCSALLPGPRCPVGSRLGRAAVLCLPLCIRFFKPLYTHTWCPNHNLLAPSKYTLWRS